MTLLARIEEAIKLCEKANAVPLALVGEGDRRFAAAARTLLPAYARALKVAVEGLEETAALRSVYSEQANSLLRAIERELTGGGE
jgi:hypothetical protein